MDQFNDHQMRNECAKEFGKIESALGYQAEWRESQTAAMARLQHEIEKLTGNGNRGKIEEIHNSITRLETILTAHVAKSDEWKVRLIKAEEVIEKHAEHLSKMEICVDRLEKLEQMYEELEGRFYNTAIKVAAAMGAGALLLQMLLDHLLFKS